MPHIDIEPAKCRLDQSSADGAPGASCPEFCLDEFPRCAGCPYADRESAISRMAEDPLKSAVLRGWIRSLAQISK
jgi:hypothetical protein